MLFLGRMLVVCVTGTLVLAGCGSGGSSSTPRDPVRHVSVNRVACAFCESGGGPKPGATPPATVTVSGAVYDLQPSPGGGFDTYVNSSTTGSVNVTQTWYDSNGNVIASGSSLQNVIPGTNAFDIGLSSTTAPSRVTTEVTGAVSGKGTWSTQ